MIKRLFLLVGGFFLLNSCQWFEKDKDIFKFENISIEQSFSQCDAECPIVSLNYLKSIKPTKFSQQFNDTIHKRLLALLQVAHQKTPQITHNDLNKAIEAYFSEYQELKKIVPEMPAYELNVVDTVLFQNDTLVSLMSNVYTYSGGAHGFQSVTFLNFDPSGRCYKNDELFTDVDSITHIAEQYFRQKENISDGMLSEEGYWFEKDQFALPENIGFEKDSLVLYYNPYEIASYSEGAKIIRIPLSRVEKWIFYNQTQ